MRLPRPTYVLHLAQRFVTSLWPAAPPPADEAWAAAQLLPGERALWARLGGADRRHAVGVARRTQALLGPDAAARPVLAAALLHDVGKVASGFGPWRRAAATVLAGVAGRDRALGWGRVGAYLDHDRRGAALLAAAGADELTAAWAAEHHRPEATWSVPLAVGHALKAADDD